MPSDAALLSIIQGLVAARQIEVSDDGERFVYHTCCNAEAFDRVDGHYRHLGNPFDTQTFLATGDLKRLTT